MKSGKIVFFSAVLLCAGTLASAADSFKYQLDNCNASKSWKFIYGREFKGAKGGIGKDCSKGLKVNYDFTGGGKYIAVYSRKKLPENINAVSVTIGAPQDAKLNYRFIDKTGRYFQGRAIVLKTGTEKNFTFNLKGPWTGRWGGVKSNQPVQPLRNFMLMVCQDKKLPPKGSVYLKKYGVLSDAELKPEFTGVNGSVNACGWKVDAEWLPSLTSAALRLKAVNTGTQNVQLSVSFPEMGRDSIFRQQLKGGDKVREIIYLPPFKDGGNLRNIYKLTLKLTNGHGESARAELMLKGANSNSINFGEPKSSKEIKPSKFGVCAHFNYGRNPAWKPWSPYKELIDIIAESGYKWVRDGCTVVKEKDGSYKVHEYDLNWIRYAKSKGIDVILCLRLYPDKSIEEYKKYMEAAVRDTRGLVKVFELGNEPNNFGWKKKYGGNWNGWNAKTKQVDQWALKHLEYTNALADHMKKVYPEITVIGLGSAACTNHLMLKEGLSKSIDGVVEHPYTFSMPPEKIPFSKNHLTRDGVMVSENGLFTEMIKNYAEESEKYGKKRSIWITEFGFTTFSFDGKNEKGLYAGFTEECQAVYLVRRFILGLAHPDIAVTCQYDLLDDYHSKEYNPEANFGIIRADHSRKPAFYAVQRMNSLFNGYSFDPDPVVKVLSQPLHRSCKRGVLVKSWDSVPMQANNEVLAFAFKNDKSNKMLAVWSAQPYSREFNNRVCSISIKGVNGYSGKPVAVDLITGMSYDVPFKYADGTVTIDKLSLKGNPIVIKLFK